MGVSAHNAGFSFKLPINFQSQEIGNKIEDFDVLQNLGQGGNGYIIKVRSKKNFKIYAIKKSKEFNDELKREVIILSKFDNPNVCKFLTYFEENGFYYIIMDLYNNKDLFRYLSAYMKIKKRIKEENIWDIFNQSLQGLTYIHNKGLIHRDIKLGNIFMDDSGKIVIGDFGLSAMYNQTEFAKLSQNEKNLLYFEAKPCGTQHFAAPEIFSGNYDQKIDVYSLGVVFFCLCFQDIPQRNNNNNNNNDNNYEQKLNFDTFYDFELRKIIFNMLIENPQQRPTSMDLFLYFKKQYIKKYVANSCIYAIIQCLFNFPNFMEYFSNSFQMSFIDSTNYKKEIFYILLAIKNNKDNITEIENNAYVLRKTILGEDTKIKDNVELSPINTMNSILNTLYYELNEIPKGYQEEEVKTFVFDDFNKFNDHFNSRFHSLISLNFTGVFKKTLKCQNNNCQGTKTLFQKYNFVNFNLQNYINYFSQNSSPKIEDIFTYFNQMYVSLKFNQLIDCNFCKIQTKHKENKQFFRLPKNLIIMLDKTKCNNINIDFDENLCLTDEKSKYIYKLYGIISDIKNINNGKTKYISFIKNNNNWLYCDNHSDQNGQYFEFKQIKNYGNIIALFYYDENRLIDSFQNNNINVNNNNNKNQQIYNSINTTNDNANQFIFNQMYNNTIDYNYQNNNNFNWQIMANNPMMNNNNNNFGNNNININNAFNNMNGVNLIPNMNQNQMNNNLGNNINYNYNNNFNQQINQMNINNSQNGF